MYFNDHTALTFSELLSNEIEMGNVSETPI